MGSDTFYSCPICGGNLIETYSSADFIKNYPGLICHECDARSVNSDGNEPYHSSMGDYGDNPVFIDSNKCWRRYRFGGYVTMVSPEGCNTLEEFYEQIYPN